MLLNKRLSYGDDGLVRFRAPYLEKYKAELDNNRMARVNNGISNYQSRHPVPYLTRPTPAPILSWEEKWSQGAKKFMEAKND